MLIQTNFFCPEFLVLDFIASRKKMESSQFFWPEMRRKGQRRAEFKTLRTLVNQREPTTLQDKPVGVPRVSGEVGGPELRMS